MGGEIDYLARLLTTSFTLKLCCKGMVVQLFWLCFISVWWYSMCIFMHHFYKHSYRCNCILCNRFIGYYTNTNCNAILAVFWLCFLSHWHTSYETIGCSGRTWSIWKSDFPYISSEGKRFYSPVASGCPMLALLMQWNKTKSMYCIYAQGNSHWHTHV